MSSQEPSITVSRMLTELCERLGYCDALRQPSRVEAQIQNGADAVVEAVLELERLNPECEKYQHAAVKRVVERHLREANIPI